MKTEILTIGDELLIGQVADTNARFMAEELTLNGFEVSRITSIGDKEEHLLEFLVEAGGRADFIFVTGGLGPTEDDITRQVISRFFNCEWETDQKLLARISEYLASRGYSLTSLNRKQARVPRESKIFINSVGTAPGIWMKKNETHYIFMPGVPFEMQQLMKQAIVPKLKHQFIKDFYKYQTIITQGLPEAYLSEKLKNWEASLPGNLGLAYLPSPGMVRLRISGRSSDEESLKNQLEEQVTKLKKLIPDYMVHIGNDSFEAILGNLLRSSGKTISTAESCTGGDIAAKIVSIPGSSEYFKGSVVAYSNAIKTEMLGVMEQTLSGHGAVSQPVVKEMAEGVLKLYQTDYSVAVSGIAGPSGGTKEKPVGLTWIAVASHEKTIAKSYFFGNKRDVNIQKATNTALNMLRKMILNEY
jgi:nicotinamide-nucleotide amidase